MSDKLGDLIEVHSATGEVQKIIDEKYFVTI